MQNDISLILYFIFKLNKHKNIIIIKITSGVQKNKQFERKTSFFPPIGRYFSHFKHQLNFDKFENKYLNI